MLKANYLTKTASIVRKTVFCICMYIMTKGWQGVEAFPKFELDSSKETIIHEEDGYVEIDILSTSATK